MAQLVNQKRTISFDSIALQKGFVILDIMQATGPRGEALAATVQSRLMQYKYMLNPQAYVALCDTREDRVLDFYDNVITFLKEATGGKHNYTPLYGDFPVSVMTEKEIVAMTDAIQYYSQKGNFDQFESILTKQHGFETNIKYNILKLGTSAELDKIFTDLVSVNTSLMPQDLEVIKYFVESGRGLVFPDKIPFKENLCTLAALGIPGLPIKSPTDVLRIAVGLSGGDISLPAVPPAEVRMNAWSRAKTSNPYREAFKFKKFSRGERRYILGLLENSSADPKEMVLKDERWIRLAEVLHPGDFAKQYPKAFQAFNAIRNTKVVSWYGKLQAHFNNKDLPKALEVLKERPGEFARRMDWLIRTFKGNIANILSDFQSCAKGISNKVLYELYNHFEGRDKKLVGRTIMIKGARKKTPLPDLPALDKKTITAVHGTIVETLKDKFKLLEPLGKVFIDPELFKIPLPTNMRTVNFTLKPTIRGQRIPIGNKDAVVLRSFYHWNDKNGDYDPDLSATFVGMGKTSVLSYSGLRVGKSCHSGDIIRRRGHCAEYIDIHVEDAKAMGFRYVVMDVRAFSGGSLSNMEGCFGIMERESPQSSTTWLPETLANAMACASTAHVTKLSIIDLDTMEYIFLDIDSDESVMARGAGAEASTLKIIQQYSEDPKVSVGHLLTWHAETRGELVSSPEEADTVFPFDDFCHDYVKAGMYMGI